MPGADEELADRGNVEDGEVIKAGLGHLGKHPTRLAHAYLSLSVPKRGLESVEILANYPNLMYVDVSANKIADLRVLELLPTLVQLNASWNNLSECLDFAPARCTDENAWSQGDQAAGSMLTLADLSNNKIVELREENLSAHPFLETLLLGHNSISRIQGLQSLAYLQVLDLSYNRITSIEGLAGLRVQELSLEGNLLTSAEGLAGLSQLCVLNISQNQIRSLYPLQTCDKLLRLEAGHNDLQHIKQTLFLRDIPWLAYLSLAGNPCCKKPHYRYRVLFRLPALKRLDASNVTAEEQIRTCNLFQVQGGDLEARAAVFAAHFPGELFGDFGPTANFVDDEQDVALSSPWAGAGAGAVVGASGAAGALAEEIVSSIIRAASPPPSRPTTAPDSFSAAAAAAPSSSSSSSIVFREGQRVEGNYRGHCHWYPGTISRVYGDGSYDIDYDDGESERAVQAALIRPDGVAQLRRSVTADADADTALVAEGSRVEVNLHGRGHWYGGMVVAVHEGRSAFDVDFDDGEKQERVPAELLRVVLSAESEPVARAGVDLHNVLASYHDEADS